MSVKCPITWNSMRVYAVTIFFGENFQKKKISLICPIWRKLFTEEEEEEIVRWGILQWCAGHLSFDLKKGHVSKFNFIFHPWICVLHYSSKRAELYFRCVIFQNAFASSKVYIWELLRSWSDTSVFNRPPHTHSYTVYINIPKKVRSFFSLCRLYLNFCHKKHTKALYSVDHFCLFRALYC